MKLLSRTLLFIILFNYGNLVKGQDSLKVEILSLNHWVMSEVKPFAASIHAEVVGVSLAFQGRVARYWSLGARGGFGNSLASFVALGGRHFATKTSIRYDLRDPYGNEFYSELYWLELYLEQKKRTHLRVEYGLRIAGFSHNDDSADDEGYGIFRGVYYSMSYGKKLFHIGAQISAGILSEPNLNEFGILVKPLILKVKF